MALEPIARNYSLKRCSGSGWRGAPSRANLRRLVFEIPELSLAVPQHALADIQHRGSWLAEKWRRLLPGVSLRAVVVAARNQ